MILNTLALEHCDCSTVLYRQLLMGGKKPVFHPEPGLAYKMFLGGLWLPNVRVFITGHWCHTSKPYSVGAIDCSNVGCHSHSQTVSMYFHSFGLMYSWTIYSNEGLYLATRSLWKVQNSSTNAHFCAQLSGIYLTNVLIEHLNKVTHTWLYQSHSWLGSDLLPSGCCRWKGEVWANGFQRHNPSGPQRSWGWSWCCSQVSGCHRFKIRLPALCWHSVWYPHCWKHAWYKLRKRNV